MEQVKLGVIGVAGRGGIAKYWAEDPRVRLAAGADPSPQSRAAFQEAHPQAALYVDYRQLLERGDITAVAVTSPDFVHEQQAVAALEAGKDVFCEKPLAITVEGCDRILTAWKDSGKKLMVGFNMRYMNMFRTMKQIVDSGVIGEIKAVWVRHFVGFGGEFYFHDWHAAKENCTSLLLQKGSHDLDIIHWLTGAYAKRVSAFGGLDYFGGDKPNDLTCPACPERDTCPDVGERLTRCAFRREVDIEDNNVVIMELEGGIKAAYLQCHFTPDYHRNYVLIGTEGRLENSEPEGKVWVKTRGRFGFKSLADRVYEVKTSSGSHGGADPVICKDFIDMLTEGKEPLAHPVAGRMSVAVGVAAAQSISQGGMPVTVAPLPERLK
jgi:predicted dehydrogenase